jgi:uncharacterized LabA/DUF88 family protein
VKEILPRRAAIFIDGSNFLAQLSDCGLGYPALKPLLQALLCHDDLALARFYGAPPLAKEFYNRWQAFADANRHVEGLEWYYGFRNRKGVEKSVDVALAVDLIRGTLQREFDRVAVIGGDGDHIYAFQEAKKLGADLLVYLMPMQKASNLRDIRVQYRYLRVEDLLQWEVCDRGAQTGVPWLTKRQVDIRI